MTREEIEKIAKESEKITGRSIDLNNWEDKIMVLYEVLSRMNTKDANDFVDDTLMMLEFNDGKH